MTSPKAVAVILCGGFSSSRPALAKLNSKKSSRYVLAALESVTRLSPLCSNVYWVVNEAEKAAFVLGPDSLLAEIAGLGFSEANFISNGVDKAADWKGDVSDLQVALRTLSASGPVLVMSDSLTVIPGYNLQRIIEHTIIRGKDTIGFTRLGDEDVALLGPRVHTEVQLADHIPLPPVTGLVPAGPSPRIGTPVAERLLVLRPSTASSPAVMASTAGGLIELGRELLSSGGLNGVELDVGRLRLDTPPCVQYADQFIEYFIQTLCPCPKGEVMDASQQSMGSTHRDFASAFDDMTSLQAAKAQFERMHFGWASSEDAEELANGKTTMLMQYKLPATFYMTAYRRQVSELMR